MATGKGTSDTDGFHKAVPMAEVTGGSLSESRTLSFRRNNSGAREDQKDLSFCHSFSAQIIRIHIYIYIICFLCACIYIYTVHFAL